MLISCSPYAKNWKGKTTYERSSVPNTLLSKKFLRQLNMLRQKILSQAQPKTLKGTSLTSRMYVNMLQSYVESINTGKLPNIETA